MRFVTMVKFGQHLFCILLLYLTNYVQFSVSQTRCEPIYVRWSRVRMNLTPKVSGPYSREVCSDACSKNEHPARGGYPLNCGGFNHKQGANSLAHDCQVFQLDQLFDVDGRAEADDRYSFYWKYCINTKNVCKAPYHFTFFTDRYMDRSEVLKSVNTFSLEDCLGKCLDEKEFTCRSATYNRTSGGCLLSPQNQLSKPSHIRVNNNPNFRIDYYESNCYNSSFEITHKCGTNGITVNVESKLPYTGALYGLYDYFTCRIEPKEEKKFSLIFPFPSRLEKRGNCSDSMKLIGKEIVLDVVLSTDGVEPLYFITPEDLTYQAKCPFPSFDKKFLGKDKVGATLEFVKDSKKLNVSRVGDQSTIEASTWAPVFTIPPAEFVEKTTTRSKDMFTLPILDDYLRPVGTSNSRSGKGSIIQVHVKIPSIQNNQIDWNSGANRRYRDPLGSTTVKPTPNPILDIDDDDDDSKEEGDRSTVETTKAVPTSLLYTIPKAAFTKTTVNLWKFINTTTSSTSSTTTTEALTTTSPKPSTTTSTTTTPTTTTTTSTTSTTTTTPTTTSTSTTTPTTTSTTTSTTPTTTSTTSFRLFDPETTDAPSFNPGTLSSRIRIRPTPPDWSGWVVDDQSLPQLPKRTTVVASSISETPTNTLKAAISVSAAEDSISSNKPNTPSSTGSTITTRTSSTETSTITTTRPAPRTSSTSTPTSTTTSTTTTTTPAPTTSTTTSPPPTAKTDPPQPILFDIFHGGQPVDAVVVGSTVTLSFTPFFAIPPSYMTVAECQAEPVGSLYSWERQPLPIIKNDCQADQVGLVCPAERNDFGMRVKVEAFRYQTTAQVQYTCLVRICHQGPCPQVFCPAVDWCEEQTPLLSLPTSFRSGLHNVREKRQTVMQQLAGLFQRGGDAIRLPASLSNHRARPPAQIQKYLNSLAGDHIVTKRLTVANSENELQYYLRTGSIPSAGLSSNFDYFAGKKR